MIEVILESDDMTIEDTILLGYALLVGEEGTDWIHWFVGKTHEN